MGSHPGRICLWGMPGVGKSTIGAALSRTAALDFCDLDERIARQQGRTVAEIINNRGQEFFRTLETEASRHFCAVGRGIMALGGGTLLEPEHRALVREHCCVVTLWTSAKVLTKRIAATELAQRPLLKAQGSLETQMSALLAERAAHYRDVDLVLEIGERGIDEVVELLETNLIRGMAA